MPQPAFIVATVIGAVPALIGLYFVLRGFTGGFEDRKLFISFAVGLILGVVAFTFHVFIDPVIFPPSPLGWLVFVVGFAFLDNIMMFAVLNHKWVRGRPDTAFYGVSLGIGFSATATMALIYRLLAVVPDFTPEVVEPLAIFTLTGVASVMLRAGTGAFIGVGSSRGEPWPWLGRAVTTQLPFGTVFMLLYYTGIYFDVLFWIPLILVMLGYSYWLLGYVRRTSLPESLPGEVKRKIRRERRRGPPKT